MSTAFFLKSATFAIHTMANCGNGFFVLVNSFLPLLREPYVNSSSSSKKPNRHTHCVRDVIGMSHTRQTPTLEFPTKIRQILVAALTTNTLVADFLFFFFVCIFLRHKYTAIYRDRKQWTGVQCVFAI